MFALCSFLTTTAQVLPTSTGSCGVSPSGLASCDWVSAVRIRNADGSTSKQRVSTVHPELFVTRFNLAPGAPLTRTIEGHDLLIVALGDGELVNETKSPPLHISMRIGSVILMPKEEVYLLRNVGKQELGVLVILTRQ